MDTEYVTEYLMVNVFYVYLVSKYMIIFFGEEEAAGRKRWLCYGFFYILNSGGHLLWHHPFINLVTSVLGIFLITCLYEASWTKRIIAVFMVYGICALCDSVIATLLGRYIMGKIIGVENNIIEYLVMLSVEVIAERHIRFNNDHNVFQKEIIAAIGVPGISIIILLILIVNKINASGVVVTIAIGLLYMNLLIFYLYDVLNKEYEVKERNYILECGISEYQNQIQVMDISQRKMDSLRHDFKHHIRALQELAADEDLNQIIKYIKTMGTFIQYEKEYVRTGNKQIDSILNYFIQKAKDEGIIVSRDIKIGMEMGIDFFDLNILFGNLLENAIEAAMQTKEKKIYLEIELEKGVLYVEVKNSCNHKTNVFSGGSIRTSKKDKDRHGYGIQNIKMIVEKYRGEVEIEEFEGFFCVNMILYLNVQIRI